jgi:hypothetical protein
MVLVGAAWGIIEAILNPAARGAKPPRAGVAETFRDARQRQKLKLSVACSLRPVR